MQATAAYAFHGDPYGDGMWTFTRGRGSYGTGSISAGPDNATHDKRILFRDWLRTTRDAAAYERSSAASPIEANGDWDFYTGGKSDFVAEIVERARTCASAVS